MRVSASADEKQQRAVAAIRENRLWFVDIPRTSSSSIKVELARHFGPAYGKTNIIESEFATEQYLPDHMLAREVRDLLGQAVWDEIFSFTIVRNPWDRVLSLYNYRMKRGKIPEAWSLAEFVKRMVEATERTPYFDYHALRRGAAEFVLDVDDTVLVKHVLRYEERAAGLEKVARRVGLPNLGRIHVQGASTPGQDFRHEYDEASRDLVAERFAKDVLLFDYTFLERPPTTDAG